jgi:hypothetical protein
MHQTSLHNLFHKGLSPPSNVESVSGVLPGINLRRNASKSLYFVRVSREESCLKWKQSFNITSRSSY